MKLDVDRSEVMTHQERIGRCIGEARFIDKEGRSLVCAKDALNLFRLSDTSIRRYCKGVVKCSVNHIVYNYLPGDDVRTLIEASKYEHKREVEQFLGHYCSLPLAPETLDVKRQRKR